MTQENLLPSRLRRPLSFLGLCAVLALPVTHSVPAQEAPEQQATAPADEERILLLDSRRIEALLESTDTATLESYVQAIAELGPRTPGMPGLDRTRDWLRDQIEGLGLELVGEQPFRVVTPVDQGFEVSIPGTDSGGFPVYALWPNFVVPSFLPETGLEAPLVYAGRGEIGEFDGKRIAGEGNAPGAVVVLDFDSGDRWQNAANLGASAVVFLPAPEATFSEARLKASETPLQFPRFYVDHEAHGQTLRRAAAAGHRVRISGSMAWTEVTCHNLLAVLPATVPEPDQESLMLTVNYDTASVVPGCAPGGLSAMNLASALTLLRALTAPELGCERTQHLLVLFDGCRGQANAGMRAFAAVLRDLNLERITGQELPEARTRFLQRKLANFSPWMDDKRQVLDIQASRVQAALDWLAACEAGGTAPPFSYEDPVQVRPGPRIAYITAEKWLFEWLKDRTKQQQILTLVDTAEAEKTAGVTQFTPLEDLPPAVRALRRRKEYYRLINDNAAGTPQARLQAMLDHPLAPELVTGHDITPASLTALLRTELAALERERSSLQGDTALRQALEPFDIGRNITLDLSAGNSILTVHRSRFVAGDREYSSPSAMEWAWTLGTSISQGCERIANLANLELGASGENRLFDFVDSVTFDASRERQAQAPEGYEFNTELFQAGVSGFTLTTGSDPRELRMGPGDRPRTDAIALRNLHTQTATAALIMSHVLQKPALFPHAEKNNPTLTHVLGAVVKKDVRAGPFPRLPVPGTLVVLSADQEIKGAMFQHRYALADNNGFFEFQAIPGGHMYEGPYAGAVTSVNAFGFSSETGMLEYAPDATMAGSGAYSTQVDLWKSELFRRPVVFQGAAVQMYGAIDPMIFYGLPDITLHQGRGAGLENWYVFRPRGHSSTLVALVPLHSRVNLVLMLPGYGNRMFLLGDQDERPTGEGYDVGTGLNLTGTPFLAARHLWKLNDSRLARLESKGVRDSVATHLHAAASRDLASMEQALDRHVYSEAYNRARSIWGRELRAYPKILGVANEAVVAAVLLMAFLLPWSLFMERITLQSGSIKARILGTLAFFAGAFVVVYLLHPAFQVSKTPIVILIAYMLASLALLSMGMILKKYGQVMRRWRERVGGIHSSDISRASAFAVAFNLGLTNMAKRPLRTALTIVMVALLAFSAMTFTSVETFLDTRKVPVPTETEARYDGVLFRLYNWASVPPSMAEAFEQDLGPDVETARRMWYVTTENPWNIGLGLNKFVFGRADAETQTDASFTAEALQGFMVREPQFSDLDTCVTGSWFSGAADEVILPTAAAEALGVRTEDVRDRSPEEQVRVKYGEKVLRVVGILDSARADRLNDISGNPLSHLDFYASGIIPSVELQAPVGTEVNVEFMPFDRTVLLPYDLLKDLGGNIKNLVARFPDDVDAGDTIDTLMSRFSINVYATLDGRTYLVKTASSQSIEGFWKMLLPVLLIVLIMVNIMLGTVDERREEIKMLGAVGLAPRHVSILYLAEACVFGVLGVVFGVILGLVVSWATRGVNVGVDVNYASVPTMMMGFLVLVIVVVATLIPAARAARLATPSGAGKWVLPESRSGDTVLALPFTVTRDNGVGIFAFLHEYLSGHSESTSPDFRCSDLEAGIVPLGRDDSELVIRSRVWLAPYDMRVSQDVTLALHRQPGLPLFSVRYEAHKTTGELSAWHRANYTFVDLLRRQFLIFRTLGDENKTAYVERAASVFAPTLAPPAVSRPPSSAPESEAAPALS